MAAGDSLCKYFSPAAVCFTRNLMCHNQQHALQKYRFGETGVSTGSASAVPLAEPGSAAAPTKMTRPPPVCTRDGLGCFLVLLPHSIPRGIGELIDDFHGQLDFAGDRQAIREGRGETPLSDGGLH